MKILRTEKEVSAFLLALQRRARGGGDEAAIEKTVRAILGSVRKKGDAALRRFTLRFDGHERIEKLPPKEIEAAAKKADKNKTFLKALGLAARRIRAFHLRQRQGSWFFDEPGVRLGQIVRPLHRVGVYVPGGKAAYPSTVLMNVIPAQVAGVKEIALAVPAPKGALNPGVMAAVRLLGVSEVYPIGGAQAVAAFAYGTKGIPKVDKIVGPGNIYVAMAKKTVFGEVDIDMIAGPSEILIIADGRADAEFIAADMLSQAEHDELASSILVTDSQPLAASVMAALKTRLSGLERGAIAGQALKKYGAVILTGSIGQAVELANRIAPEHLEIMTKNPRAVAKGIKNAGALFVGKWSPEPLGDYAAGPNHTLPTGGTARFSSPLGVYDFLKHTSYLEFTEEGFRRLAPAVERLASAEGLTAHKEAVSVRRKKPGGI